jgi:hypothetical protein
MQRTNTRVQERNKIFSNFHQSNQFTKMSRKTKKKSSIFGSSLGTSDLEDVMIPKYTSKSSADELNEDDIETEQCHPYNLSVDVTKVFLDKEYSTVHLKIELSGFSEKPQSFSTKERINSKEPLFLDSFNL